VRQSGKNSADIRLVVDALDLCYTKSHVNTFVIVSGDSDFSPLVSKLRENDKYVIGVGVKHSTSDLLIANCDEFIFYDDLVREIQRTAARRDPKPAAKRSPEEDKRRKEEMDARKSEAVELAVSTYEALVAERGDGGKIWASMLKNAIKRRKPDFNESYYGFRVFGNLLDEAQARGLLEVGRDEKSGAFVARSLAAVRSDAPVAAEVAVPELAAVEESLGVVTEAASAGVPSAPASDAATAPGEGKRRSRSGSKRGGSARAKVPAVESTTPAPVAVEVSPAPAPEVVKPVEAEQTSAVVGGGENPPAGEPAAEARPEKKPASRSRRPRKPKAPAEAAS
jgi:hypothetical protein